MKVKGLQVHKRVDLLTTFHNGKMSAKSSANISEWISALRKWDFSLPVPNYHEILAFDKNEPYTCLRAWRLPCKTCRRPDPPRDAKHEWPLSRFQWHSTSFSWQDLWLYPWDPLTNLCAERLLAWRANASFLILQRFFGTFQDWYLSLKANWDQNDANLAHSWTGTLWPMYDKVDRRV